MKYIMGIMIVLLVGCSNHYEENPPVAMPPELSDCKFYKITRMNESNLNVVRCPNSSTSVNWSVNHGKHGTTHHNTITVDGVEYTRKETN